MIIVGDDLKTDGVGVEEECAVEKVSSPLRRKFRYSWHSAV